MKITMPAGARHIIEQLNNNGFEAFIVGGCVRDCLLGKMPNDWDITTNAKPEQVKSIFSHTVDTGIEHGTVTVLVERNIVAKDHDAQMVAEGKDAHYAYAYEVTTYRVDGVYEDHRRPKDVTFTASLEEDLKRRDFTINAMAYNDDQGVIDVFGGIKDLEDGIIRCVGVPSERFDEDALRILRAVRFAAQLGFVIEDATQNAMREQAKFLADISAERIQVELTKLIMSAHPDMLVKAYELGLTRIILPEFDLMMETEQNNPYHMYSVGWHTIHVMEHVPAQMIARYAALLHDIGKPDCKTTDDKGIDHFYGHPELSKQMANTILRRLKLDNHTISAVQTLVLNHDYGISGNIGIKAFRRFLGKLGIDNFDDFVMLRKADMAGQSDYKLAEKTATIESLQEMYETVVREKQAIGISDLAITGKDLIAMGMKPGRELGQVLHELLEHVLDVPEDNTSEILLSMANKLINK